MKFVVLAIPTLTPAGASRARSLINAARAGTRAPDLFFVIDNGGHFGEQSGVVVHRPVSNIGVAPSWNLALRQFGVSAHVIIANDDIELAPHSIERLVKAADDAAEDVAIVATEGHAFSLFLHRQEAVRRVGYYDEGFVPAYYEDTDYLRRVLTARMRVERVDTGSVHHEQTTTRELGFAAADRAPYWSKNRRRYTDKWGGEPGAEKHEFAWGVHFEVVVPMRRTQLAGRLLRSLAWQSVRPTRVSLVTNGDLTGIDTQGLRVRQLSFDSTVYAIGEGDVSLRRNIGTYAAEAPFIVYSDDDQVWPQDAMEHFARLFAAHERFVVGHHRFVPVERMQDERLRVASPHEGRTREHGVNREHGWQSCYAGCLGVATSLVRELGGWDLALARGEDQQLAIRHGGGPHARTFVREPPFAWHPEGREAAAPEPRANTCVSRGEAHEWVVTAQVSRCTRCPAVASKRLDAGVVVPFNPDHVIVTQTWL